MRKNLPVRNIYGYLFKYNSSGFKNAQVYGRPYTGGSPPRRGCSRSCEASHSLAQPWTSPRKLETSEPSISVLPPDVVPRPYPSWFLGSSAETGCSVPKHEARAGRRPPRRSTRRLCLSVRAVESVSNFRRAACTLRNCRSECRIDEPLSG